MLGLFIEVWLIYRRLYVPVLSVTHTISSHLISSHVTVTLTRLLVLVQQVSRCLIQCTARLTDRAN